MDFPARPVDLALCAGPAIELGLHPHDHAAAARPFRLRVRHRRVHRQRTQVAQFSCGLQLAALAPLSAGARWIAETVARVTGFKGRLVFDATKPDGTPRKLMDVSRLKLLGWQAQTSLEDGLRLAYDWFVANQDQFRE